MQNEYRNLVNTLNNNGLLRLEQQYCQPLWMNLKLLLKDIILGPVHQNIISNSPLTANMVVPQGWSHIQNYETCFLRYCIGEETQALVARVKDTNFDPLPRECQEFNCSTSSLVHLYYAAKSMEQFKDKNITSIAEFGGGYGNLARIFKEMLPNVTYYIIDLPELIAIQYLFLQATLPANTEVLIHSQLPNEFKRGAIHLVPVFLAENLNVTTDLFVSTFAISEGFEAIQKIISGKNFLDASVSYIVGTLPGSDWVHHSVLHNAMRASYNIIECQPSYLFFHPRNLQVYEMIGLNRQV